MPHMQSGILKHFKMIQLSEQFLRSATKNLTEVKLVNEI